MCMIIVTTVYDMASETMNLTYALVMWNVGVGATELGTPGAQSSLVSGFPDSTSVDWGREGPTLI
jgi:hypothetical protein